MIATSLEERVVAQTGKSKYVCKNIEARDDFGAAEFETYLKSCRCIISHAGIGTILNAQKFQKPIILVPRLARFKEHRNDHQLATCKTLAGRPGIRIVQDPGELTPYLITNTIEPVPSGENNPNRQMMVSFLVNTFQAWGRHE